MVRLRILAFLLPSLALLAACRQLPSPASEWSAAGRISTSPDAPPQGASSPSFTPQPVVPAPTYPGRVLWLATSTPAPELLPNIPPSDVDLPPALSSTAEVPPPVEALLLPPGVEILALLGTDAEESGVGRTDTILLVFYNRQTGRASLVSVPRDLYVYLPGLEMNRINTAFYKGGFDLLARTFEYNLGVRPDHWAAANFSAFVRFIDDLGGVSVPVSDPMPDDCGGIPPGTVHMDGATALCYLRERRTTSDIDRSRRQQEVLQMILKRVIALESLRHLPEWYERYRESIMTDLTLPDLIAFIPLVLKLPDSDLQKHQISWDQVEVWKVPDSGAQVFLPQRERISALLHQAIADLGSPVPDSRAFESRVAALTATAPVPASPDESRSPEPEEPADTATPTLEPASTDPSP